MFLLKIVDRSQERERSCMILTYLYWFVSLYLFFSNKFYKIHKLSFKPILQVLGVKFSVQVEAEVTCKCIRIPVGYRQTGKHIKYPVSIESILRIGYGQPNVGWPKASKPKLFSYCAWNMNLIFWTLSWDNIIAKNLILFL